MDFAMEPDYNHGNELTERDIWIDDIWKVLRELPRNAKVNIAMDSLDNLAKEQPAQQARKDTADRAVAFVEENGEWDNFTEQKLRAAILGEEK